MNYVSVQFEIATLLASWQVTSCYLFNKAYLYLRMISVIFRPCLLPSCLYDTMTALMKKS